MPWDDDIDWYPAPVDPGDNIDAGGGWNPGSGYDPGDNIDQGGGWNPGSGSSGGFDWGSLVKGLFSGGSKNPLADLFNTNGGGLDISSILALLALAGGITSGVNAGNTAKQGGADIKAAADKSNELATDLFGKAQANFAPFQTAGQNALTSLQTPIDLASKYVSQGQQSNLGSKFNGAMTLAQLAKR